jgi:hypothetical protein
LMEDLSVEEGPSSFYRRDESSSRNETGQTIKAWFNSKAELTWICFSSFSSLQLLKNIHFKRQILD